MISVTRLSTSTTNDDFEFRKDDNNFFHDIMTVSRNIFKDEIESNREFIFSFNIKCNILKGAHIINAGRRYKTDISYHAIMKYAVEDNADEVIVCHNHVLTLDRSPEYSIIASKSDLGIFSDIFSMFTLCEMTSLCVIFGGSCDYAGFYYPQNGLNKLLSKSGYTRETSGPYVEYSKQRMLLKFRAVTPSMRHPDPDTSLKERKAKSKTDKNKTTKTKGKSLK